MNTIPLSIHVLKNTEVPPTFIFLVPQSVIFINSLKCDGFTKSMNVLKVPKIIVYISQISFCYKLASIFKTFKNNRVPIKNICEVFIWRGQHSTEPC